MIIFTPFYATMDVIMQCRQEQYTFYELNLSSSLVSSIPILSNLIPSPEFVPQQLIERSLDSQEFDITYGNSIVSDISRLTSLMQIVYPVFADPTAVVLVYIERSPYRDTVMESLIKLIQARYGYNSILINEPDDLLCIEDTSTFSIPGLHCIDNDIEICIAAGYISEYPREDD